MDDIIKINKYGTDVYCDVEADDMRRERCMCWKCTKLHPNQSNNCCHAQIFFEECKQGMAIMVTRCKDFNPKE